MLKRRQIKAGVGSLFFGVTRQKSHNDLLAFCNSGYLKEHETCAPLLDGHFSESECSPWLLYKSPVSTEQYRSVWYCTARSYLCFDCQKWKGTQRSDHTVLLFATILFRYQAH